jgi:uncharacterized protein with ATP-grasp and redox domains
MLAELSSRLERITEQKRLKLKLEKDLARVKAELQTASTQLVELESQLKKERVDVERLEKLSLTGLLYSALGTKDQRLDEERQELLTAQLRYQQSKKQITFLEQDKNSIENQLSELEDVEDTFDRLLIEKGDLLRLSNQPVAKHLLELAGQIADLNAQMKEIAEASAAGRVVLVGMDEIITSLKSAEGWGVWDILGGGLLTTAIKHSRIDDARTCVFAVQKNMNRFKRELADINEKVELSIDISAFASFADFFFDGLIIDWLVQEKIETSLEQVRSAKKKVNRAVKKLEELKKATQTQLDDLHTEFARLVEAA